MDLEQEIEANRRRIRTDGYAMSIGEITSIYERGELDIHPEFQRYFRWSDQQKSALIESVLLGIPLPSIFVSQREDGVWDVVDGLQRLSTIFQLQGVLKYEDNRHVEPLILQETRYLKLLQGKRWNPEPNGGGPESVYLSAAQQIDIKRAKLDIKIMLRTSDAGTQNDLFERLNTNGSPLSDQENRNNLLIMTNRESFKKLKAISSDMAFKNTLSLSERNAEEQYDVELALRFCIFYSINVNNLKGLRDLSQFLNTQMVARALAGQLLDDELESTFKGTFALLDSALEDNSFRRYDTVRKRFTGGFLVSAYEVVALGIAFNWRKWSSEHDSAKKINARVKKAWAPGNYLSQPRMGVSQTSRIPETLRVGRQLFK